MGFRVKIAVLAVLPVVAVVVAFVASGTMATRADPGLYIVFELYEHPGGADEVPRLSRAGDVYTCVIAEAVLPCPPDFLLLGSGCYSGVPAVYIPHDRIKKAVNAWVLELIARESPSIGEHVFGLILRVYVVNATAEEVMYTVLDSIPLKIGDFATPQAVVYVARNVKGWPQVYSEKHTRLPDGAVVLGNTSDRITWTSTGTPMLQSCVECEQVPVCVCRVPVVMIRPEDLYPYLLFDYHSYYKSFNGVVYIKTPVLIINNANESSGVITASVDVSGERAGLELRLTVGIGNILESIRGGALPSLNFQLGGATFGGQGYYYYRGLFAPNWTATWAYVWARFVQRYWQEYVCYHGYCEHLHDVVEGLITNILTKGARIEGGVEISPPPTRVVEDFYAGTSIEKPRITDTALDDGDLDVNESIALPYIIQYYDTCGSGFEIGIPVGAYAARALCRELSFLYRTPACKAAVEFASSILVSLGLEGTRVSVNGSLANYGRRWGYGYDVDEVVYVRVSRYRYEVPPPWWCSGCSPCRFRAPAGLYFRCG